MARHFLGTVAAGLLGAFVYLQVHLGYDENIVKAQLLVFVLLALLLYASVGERHRRFRCIANWSLLSCAVVSFCLENVRDLHRTFSNHAVTRIWNVYHYYLGSKYFDELGYNGLYDFTCLADDELTRLIADNTTIVRDLTDLKFIPLDQAVARASADRDRRFTPERWVSFKRDFAFLRDQAPGKKWAQMLRDRGYNPTPFWTVVGRLLTASVDLYEWRHLLAMMSLDWFLALVALIVFAWAFGLHLALAILAIFCLHFANDDRLIGGIIQYDWFFTVVLALALYHKNRKTLSAVALAYAACARVFPGFLLLGPLIRFVYQKLRRRPDSERFPRFALDFTIACLLFTGLGTATSHGHEAWSGFYHKIRDHSQNQIYSQRRVGLKMVFAHDYSRYDRPHGEEKPLNFENQKYIYYAAGAVLYLAAAAACCHTSGAWSMLLGFAFIFVSVILSRYYWSILLLLILFIHPAFRLNIRALVTAFLTVTFVGHYCYEAYADSPYHSYLYVNIFLAIFFLALPGALLLRRNREQCTTHDETVWDAEAQAAVEPV